MKVYGPYTRKDNRQHVIIIDGDTRRTVSYPKWLMEQKLGRELDPDLETIDHIDGDFTNNSWENLQVLTRSEHSKKDARPAETVTFICPVCEETATKSARHVRWNRKQGKSGPYCGRVCAARGSAGTGIQA